LKAYLNFMLLYIVAVTSLSPFKNCST